MWLREVALYLFIAPITPKESTMQHLQLTLARAIWLFTWLAIVAAAGLLLAINPLLGIMFAGGLLVNGLMAVLKQATG